MPGALRDWLGLAIVAACVIVLLAIGAAATFFLGFLWAVAICAFIGWLISLGDLGPNGEGACGVIICWILLAIGVAIGLALGLVLK